MWCEKCHYGSESVVLKKDANGNHQCFQCGTLAPPMSRNPFPVKGRTLHGGGTKGGGNRQDKPAPKKFVFDQKGGSDSGSEFTSETVKVQEVTEKKVEGSVSGATATVYQVVEDSPTNS